MHLNSSWIGRERLSPKSGRPLCWFARLPSSLAPIAPLPARRPARESPPHLRRSRCCLVMFMYIRTYICTAKYEVFIASETPPNDVLSVGSHQIIANAFFPPVLFWAHVTLNLFRGWLFRKFIPRRSAYIPSPACRFPQEELEAGQAGVGVPNQGQGAPPGAVRQPVNPQAGGGAYGQQAPTRQQPPQVLVPTLRSAV